MSLAEPFITPVSKAGLPANYCHNKALGDEVIQGLTAHALAKVYWTLESLTIDYAFTVDGVHVERQLHLPTTLHPIDRIGGGALFAQQQELPDRDQLAYLDGRDPRETTDGRYAIDLEVLEVDYAPNFMLCLGAQTHYPELYVAHVYPFTLFEKTLEAKLYLRLPRQTGWIHHFAVHPKWFTFS